ncbi:MAG: DUF1318 domain-containing protein [Desulfobulbaceae bacterium]|nr:hypothetical protein [Chloroflexota bacterium]TBV80101.1 MAG: DUF1318 domain-containing protein [Desulfobulbaceae bacterium]
MTTLRKCCYPRGFKKLPVMLLSVLSLLLWLAPGAAAMTLQDAINALGEAKNQGLVGEQSNGYLGVVAGNARGEAIAYLINNARRAEYQRMARENNISLQDVELMAGQKAINLTPPGQFIRMPDGQWRRR